MFKENYFRKIAVSGGLHKQIRFLATARNNGNQHFKLVIAGAGAGGATMAARLASKLGGQNIAVIEPSDVHYYQPYFTLIGAGIKQLEDSCRQTSGILPKDVNWIKDSVIAFNPLENNVVTKYSRITYDYLIVAMGLILSFNKIKGLPEAFQTPGVCSNYSPETVNKTAFAISQCKTGNAIFTQPINPIKCAGAPQKIMYLADDIFKKTGRRKDINVSFFTALNVMFSVPKYDKVLKSVAESKGIKVNYEHSLIEVNPDKKEAVFEQVNDGSIKTIPYEMLHITPPMSPPIAIKDSDLCNSTGYLDVNKNTLQHNVHKNIFGIGDCTSIPTSKTAAAVASQCGILTTNLMAAIEGKSLSLSYTGYTSCPLVTGNSKGILAEFDFDLEPVETLPIDQGKERYVSFFLKKDILPYIYWNLMLKGHWKGPAFLRKIFHLGQ